MVVRVRVDGAEPDFVPDDVQMVVELPCSSTSVVGREVDKVLVLKPVGIFVVVVLIVVAPLVSVVVVVLVMVPFVRLQSTQEDVVLPP